MSLISMGSVMLNLLRFIKLTPVVAAIAVAVVFCSPALPQGNTGRILGTVVDQSGGAVADATVTILDVARGTSSVLTTDSSGAYVALNLLPGTYKVRVEAKGFKAFERQNLLLETGKDLQIDITLQTGSASEVITVTEEIPLIDATSTTLGGTLSNETINDLPLNGRNYQNLLSLRPGTMVYPGGGPWTQSTNGIRPEDTSYIVDGLTNDEAFMGLSVTNAAAVAGDAATLLPIDAIQEFNTQVNPKAEFGWKPGAITSVGIKSGTNTLHGTAYGFGRTDSFDARNYFNPVGTPKPPVELEQFGGTVGGRIIPDKLFYFGGYEGQRYTVGNAIPVSVPTTVPNGDPGNSLPDAIAAIGGPGNVNALSNYLLQFYGANSQTGPNANVITRTFPNVNNSNNAIGKVDYHLNDRNTISGSYFFGNDSLIAMDAPETIAEFRTGIDSRAQALSAHWAWIPNSTWANELRYGFTHYTLDIIPSNVNTKYDINTGITNPVLGGLPNIRVTGFSELGGFHNFPKIVGPDSVNDIIDQVSYLRGKHAVKFGGEIRGDQVHQGTFRAGRGRIKFNSFQDFLLGNPDSVSLLAGDPTRNLTQRLYALYAQDDWRITKNITLNLGLRWEYQGVPSEANNLLGNWEPSVGLEQVGKISARFIRATTRTFHPA